MVVTEFNLCLHRDMHTPDAEFGARLRKARRELGLSQAEVADGVATASFMSLIESGKRLPSPKVAAILAGRVGIAVDATAGDRGGTPAGAPAYTAALAAVRAADAGAAEAHCSELPKGWPGRDLIDGLLLEMRGELEAARALLAAALGRAEAGSELWLELTAALCRVAFNAGAVVQAVEVGEAALAQPAPSTARGEDLIVELRATLSGVYCDTGNLARARELVEGAPDDGTPWQRGTQLWARSIVAVVAGEREVANAYAAEALRLFRQSDRPLSLARLQVNAAALLTLDPSAGLDESVRLLEAAERTFRTHQVPFDLAGCLAARAHIDALRGDIDGARFRAGEALLLVRDEGAGLRARIYASVALASLVLGDRAGAEAHLLEARALLESAGANRAAASTWRQMASAYEEMGHLDLALACMKAATDLLGVHAQPTASAHASV